MAFSRIEFWQQHLLCVEILHLKVRDQNSREENRLTRSLLKPRLTELMASMRITRPLPLPLPQPNRNSTVVVRELGGCLRSAFLAFFYFALAHQTHAQVPKLSIVSAGNESFILSWPATAAGYVLESAQKLDAFTAWRAVANSSTLANAEFRLVITIKDSAQFFRLGLAPALLAAEDFAIGDYTLISSTSISPSVSEDTYKAYVSNWSDADATVTASLGSTAAHITVLEGRSSFGEVAVGASVESSDTFTVRHDHSKPFDDAALIWAIQATSLPPTTFELIDKALNDGFIDAETALVYRVFDEFNDVRLPAQYRGRDDGFFEATAIREARQLFKTLSPATQQLLTPLLHIPDMVEIAQRTPQSAMGASTPSVIK